MNAPLDADDALTREVLAATATGTTTAGGPSQEVSFPPGAPTPPPSLSHESPPAQPEPERIPEFDPRFREQFEGLLFVGHLTDTVSYWGHSFRLVTPSSNERLQVALLTKPYDGTIGADFAYECGLVAAYLVQVDGRDLPQPITNDPKDTAIQQRWEWVLNNLKKPVVDHLFNECFRLDGEVRKALEAMGKV